MQPCSTQKQMPLSGVLHDITTLDPQYSSWCSGWRQLRGSLLTKPCSLPAQNDPAHISPDKSMPGRRETLIEARYKGSDNKPLNRLPCKPQQAHFASLSLQLRDSVASPCRHRQAFVRRCRLTRSGCCCWRINTGRARQNTSFKDRDRDRGQRYIF